MKVDLTEQELAYIVRLVHSNVVICERYKLGSNFKGLLERLKTLLSLSTR
jgi:hypothetical protein